MITLNEYIKASGLNDKMISITNVDVYGLEKTIKRSGYPMRTELDNNFSNALVDYKRAKTLGSVKTGTGHDNLLKGIIVQFDLEYTNYWTPQAQRYHWFDIISSSSKMHRLVKMDISKCVNKYVDSIVIDNLNKWIDIYNKFPKKEDLILGCVYVLKDNEVVLSLGDYYMTKYEVYMKVISNAPLGLMQFEAVTTNYLQLKTMYHQRKNHKLKEDWGYFCNWIESLPYFKEIVLGE
ncbi:MAG: hypothetical protein ACRC0R_02625 [Cetobacterium sp.]